ncbi:MAG: nitroreductase family deazaflavin-dependent oxidoreductase [Thermoleophilia bacterium]
MAFASKAGTRGARQPGGFVLRAFNTFLAKRIRKGGGRAMGTDTLLLITVGSKTGQTREAPLARFDAPGGGWYVAASANGARQNPSWYHNVAAHPDLVRVVVAGTEYAVTAEQVTGAERDQAWQRICGEHPRFGKYGEKTDREIPIIRLTPRGE